MCNSFDRWTHSRILNFFKGSRHGACLKCGNQFISFDLSRISSPFLMGMLILVSIFESLHSQPVEIINADILTIYSSDSGMIRKMTGNVQFKHDSVMLYCDSALHYADINFLKAHSRVRIVLTDTTQITGEELHYDGELKVAELFRNVLLKDGKTTLKTQRLTYFRNSGMAVYPQQGILRDGENTLSSETGVYHTDTKKVYFKRKVLLTNPDFRLVTDTLAYHTETKTALFVDDTYIYMKEDTLFTRSGFYDTEQKRAELYQNPWIKDSTYCMTADTLKYDQGYDFGEGIGQVHLFKKDSSIQLFGHCGEFHRKTGESLISGEPWLVQHLDEDTLHLTADYFYSKQDSLEDTMRIAAWPKVRIVMRNLQAASDSLEYNRKDSILYLYYDPILWSDNHQMTGDTIVLTLRNENPDSLHVYPKGFLISKEDTIGFNQVKGREVFGKFESGALNRMRVSGNAESIYFTRNEEKNTYEGMNQSLSNEIFILFNENKPSRITFSGKPEGTFHPIFEVIDSPNRLEDFNWREAERPELGSILGPLPWKEKGKYLSRDRSRDRSRD